MSTHTYIRSRTREHARNSFSHANKHIINRNVDTAVLFQSVANVTVVDRVDAGVYVYKKEEACINILMNTRD